jgi:hypothetical protein
MRNFALGMIALFTLAISLSASPVYANAFTSDSLVVNIPFEFRAGEKTLPAGKYVVGRLSQSSSCFLLQNADGGPSVAVMTAGSLQSGRKPLPARLVFNNYRGNYFLAQVWTQSYSSGAEISKSEEEREIAKRIDHDDLVAVVADRR